MFIVIMVIIGVRVTLYMLHCLKMTLFVCLDGNYMQ